LDIQEIGYKEHASAYLASAWLSRSEKVETSRFLVDLYRNLCENITIETEIDYLSALLVTGRILDTKTKRRNLIEEITNFIPLLKTSVIEVLTAPVIGSNDKSGAEKLIEAYKVNDNDLAAALLTTSYVYITQEIESVKKIAELWGIIRDEDLVQHKLDYLAAILASGRIRDLKAKVDVIKEIRQITKDLKKVIVDKYQLDLENIEQRDIACAFITAAYVSITPPIETSSQIIGLWEETRNNVNLDNSDLDLINAILICGVIRGFRLDEDWKILNNKIESIRTNLS
jgi:hypothetical protein